MCVTDWRSWLSSGVVTKETQLILVFHALQYYCLASCFHVGVVARKKAYLPYIKKALTSEAVANYFEHLLEDKSKVQRSVLHF